jgi:hypothetical protein
MTLASLFAAHRIGVSRLSARAVAKSADACRPS